MKKAPVVDALLSFIVLVLFDGIEKNTIKVQAQEVIDSDNLFLPLHDRGRPNVFLKDFPPTSLQQNQNNEEGGSIVGDHWIPPKRESLFFTVHQKGGSSTMKNVVTRLCGKYSQDHKCQDHNNFRPDEPCRCEEFNRYQFTDRGAWCSGCSDKQWITMFREPMSRLISAYKYCQVTWDELCNAEKDICSFGRKWGNYQMNRYLEYPLHTTKNPITKVSNPAFDIQRYGLVHCPSCGQFDPSPHHKLAPNDEYMFAAIFHHFGLNNISTPQGQVHLERLKTILTESYLAVGLLEEWDDSMEMYYVATGLEPFLGARGANAANKNNRVPPASGAAESRRALAHLNTTATRTTVTEIAKTTTATATTAKKEMHMGKRQRRLMNERRMSEEEAAAWEREIESQVEGCKEELLGFMSADIALYEHVRGLFETQRFKLQRWREEGKVIL